MSQPQVPHYQHHARRAFARHEPAVTVERGVNRYLDFSRAQGRELARDRLYAHNLRIRQHMSAYVSIRQHTSAYVSIRQHTSAYVSIALDLVVEASGEETRDVKRQSRCRFRLDLKRRGLRMHMCPRIR